MISPDLRPLPSVNLELTTQWINDNMMTLKAPNMLFMPTQLNLLAKRQMEQNQRRLMSKSAMHFAFDK